jgi:O-antigen ligase
MSEENPPGDAMAKGIVIMTLLTITVASIITFSITFGLQVLIGFASIYKWVVGLATFVILVLAALVQVRFG